MRIPRTRGTLSGLLLMVLGLWGGLIPFVGPYFNYTIGPSTTWDWTAGRLWLSVLPAAAVFFGGLLLIASANRPTGVLGAWLALAGGVWFVVGQSISMLWNHGISQAGLPQGGTLQRTVEQIGWFYGLGAVVTALAGVALGRMLVVSVRDRERAAARDAEAGAAGGAAAAAPTRRTGRFDRTRREGAVGGPVAERERERELEPVGAGATGAGATAVHQPAAGPTVARDRPAAGAAPGPDPSAGTTATGRRRRGGLFGLIRRG